MLKQQAKLVARIVYFVDVMLTAAAFFGAFYIRDYFLPILAPERFPTGLYPLTEYLKLFPVVLVIWSVLLFQNKSYRSHRTTPIRAEALETLRIVAVGTVILETVAWMFRLDQLSRTWFGLFVALDAILLISV